VPGRTGAGSPPWAAIQTAGARAENADDMSISRMMENPLATTALMGSLTHFSLASVLRLLQSSHKTGRLELQRGEERTELFLEDGSSLFARTNGPALRIGDMLVRRGDLRPEAIELALTIQQENPEGRLGRMLVDNGVVSEAQVRDAVLAVQRHIVLTAMKWRKGIFRFGVGERLSGEDIRLDLDVDEILMWAVTSPELAFDYPDDQRAA